MSGILKDGQIIHFTKSSAENLLVLVKKELDRFEEESNKVLRLLNTDTFGRFWWTSYTKYPEGRDFCFYRENRHELLEYVKDIEFINGWGHFPIEVKRSELEKVVTITNKLQKMEVNTDKTLAWAELMIAIRRKEREEREAWRASIEAEESIWKKMRKSLFRAHPRHW